MFAQMSRASLDQLDHDWTKRQHQQSTRATHRNEAEERGKRTRTATMASGDNSNHNLPPSQFTFKAHSLSALPANNFKFASNPPPSSSTQTQSQTAAGRPISSVGPASVEGHANGNNARQASRASGNSYLGEVCLSFPLFRDSPSPLFPRLTLLFGLASTVHLNDS